MVNNSTMQLKKNGRGKDKNGRTMHPNSLKNLEKKVNWVKGQSGNPAGQSITSIVKDLLRADAGNGKTYAHLAAEVMVDGIIDEVGNLKHGVNVPLIREVLDRTEGKVATPIAVTGHEGKEVVFRVIRDNATE